jgi:hypothetical protein
MFHSGLTNDRSPDLPPRADHHHLSTAFTLMPLPLGDDSPMLIPAPGAGFMFGRVPDGWLAVLIFVAVAGFVFGVLVGPVLW